MVAFLLFFAEKLGGRKFSGWKKRFLLLETEERMLREKNLAG